MFLKSSMVVNTLWCWVDDVLGMGPEVSPVPCLTISSLWMVLSGIPYNKPA